MSFAAPLLLLGIGAAGVPVLIHLIGRRRAPRRRFAAIDFVLRSDRKLARRLKVRHLLVLALRMAIAAGIAVMIAKPFTETESDLPAVGGVAQSAVLVLDDSLSMRRRVDGQVIFRRAQRKARELLHMLGQQADVAVLSLSQPSGPLGVLTRESRKVLSALGGLQASSGHALIAPALVAAGRILAESSFAARHVFVFTDMAAHSLSSGNLEDLLPSGIALHLIDVARDTSPDNRAVTELVALASPAPGPRTMQIRGRICNYAPTRSSVHTTLSINGHEVARGVQELDPWSCRTKAFHHSFARGGMHNASLSLDDDQLPDDNVRYLRLEVATAVRVLLVNGAPSPVRYRDELFYLQAALEAGAPDSRSFETRVITVDEVGQARFTAYDVIVFCNVREVPKSRIEELRAFVERGGGLLISVGDNVDAERLNASLGALLPGELRGPLTAAPPGTGAPALRFGRIDGSHPLLAAVWSEDGGAGLRAAHFWRIFQLRPDPRTDKRVIIRYDDDSPALLEGRRGAGRVLLLTTTIDRDWNDLPIRPGYLPLVQQIVRHLSGATMKPAPPPLEAGGNMTLRLGKQTQEVRLIDPREKEHQWSARDLAGKSALEIPVPLPGFYKLSLAGADGVLHTLERESFMANVNPSESDLRKGRGQQRSGAGAATGSHARARRRVELWHTLGALLLLLLLAESFVTRRG